MRDQFTAWAIDTRSSESHSFLGRYWLFANSHRDIPPHLEGCQVALFRTRQLAREARAGMKPRGDEYEVFPDSQVVKVKVTIEEVKE